MSEEKADRERAVVDHRRGRKLTEAEKRKAEKGKCIVKFCRNRREPNCAGGHYYHCSKHRGRRKRKQSPWNIKFHATKQSAKRRGIEWKLTYPEFKEWAEKNLDRGLTIDRIDPTGAYELSNLRPLVAEYNSKYGADYAAAKRRGEEYKPVIHEETEDPF